MRFLAASLLLLACGAHANYFSEGWKPGQPTAKARSPAATFKAAPAAPAKKDSSFLTNLLTTGPLGSLFSRAGMNISDAISRAQADIWDTRIPLVTDENYEQLIVNETLTSEEEERRVWFLIITASGSRDSLSQYTDKQFDEAYNITLAANDLPHVRFGRIDYMDVTYLTTKWVVWRAPFLVVLTNRGQTLRFYRPSTLVTKAQAFHDFLKLDAWKATAPWAGPWAPGGSREKWLDFYAVWSAVVYRKIVAVPKILLLVITGGLTSVIISFLHRRESAQRARTQNALTKEAKPVAAPVAAPAPTHGAENSTKRRKSGRS